MMELGLVGVGQIASLRSIPSPSHFRYKKKLMFSVIANRLSSDVTRVCFAFSMDAKRVNDKRRVVSQVAFVASNND